MDDATLRDELALVRTRLANERTLLGYIRTALALLAAGAALLQFFPRAGTLAGLAWLLLAAGLVALAVGISRFVRVNRSLGRRP